MPPRSVKMKRRILGFQRRVWWPKWTPASSSSRIETTDTVMSSLRLGFGTAGEGRGRTGTSRHRHPSVSPGRRDESRGILAARTKEGLLHLADEAMYLVKNTSRDCVAAANIGILPDTAPAATKSKS